LEDRWLTLRPAVLITGATSGLGRYLAGQLAGSGWQVLAHGRDPARVADVAAELGGGTRGYVADLASLGDVRELAALVRAEVPRLDVLVNNAGIGFGAPGEGREVSADGHELRFAVNYRAGAAREVARAAADRIGAVQDR
jgi:NAD(P)-dependent dehydrogenase (short-subunit alcohol dehydrogenase family)